MIANMPSLLEGRVGTFTCTMQSVELSIPGGRGREGGREEEEREFEAVDGERRGKGGGIGGKRSGEEFLFSLSLPSLTKSPQFTHDLR